jgi:type I restriction-modification system DNA methylase subunit
MHTTDSTRHNLHILSAFKNNTAPLSLLKQYTGWGGLRKAIYTPAVYHELRKSLTGEEITSLKKTLTSAYYTPHELVTFIYNFIQLHGFYGGDILEPSAGHGVFLEHIPEPMKQNSTITAVEMDQVSCQLVNTLYPDVKVYTQGFETFHPDQRYDLVVGNPPYGIQKLEDARHEDLRGLCIHHYFVAKCMRLLKQGGMLAMVLPSYVLDNLRDHPRQIDLAKF